MNKALNVAAGVEHPERLLYEPRASSQALRFGGFGYPNELNVVTDARLQFDDEITIAYFLKLNSKSGMNGYGGWVSNGIHDILNDTVGKVNTRLFTHESEPSSITMYYPTASDPAGWKRLVANNLPPVGIWVHIAFVISKNTATSYVNGVVSETYVVTSSDFSMLNGGFSIGKSGEWYPLNGWLDDFRLYNYPLTAEDVFVLSQQ